MGWVLFTLLAPGLIFAVAMYLLLPPEAFAILIIAWPFVAVLALVAFNALGLRFVPRNAHQPERHEQ